MPARRALALLAFALLAGCDEKPSAPAPAVAPPPPPAARFDPASAGDLVGRVTWRGKAPVVPPFRSRTEPLNDKPTPIRDWPNPNAPRIGPTGGALSAVVSLQGVDPQRSRPWNHPPVSLELREHVIHVRQGKRDGEIGLVHVGDEVEIASRQAVYHHLQGRGDDFFGLALPEPNQPRRRRFTRPGIVELTSGAGYFWMRGYLIVSDHPYHALPEGEGNYRLEGIPAGEYRVVAWHPNWRVSREERNPDLANVQHLHFREPRQVEARIRIEAGKTARADLELSAEP